MRNSTISQQQVIISFLVFYFTVRPSRIQSPQNSQQCKNYPKQPLYDFKLLGHKLLFTSCFFISNSCLLSLRKSCNKRSFHWFSSLIILSFSSRSSFMTLTLLKLSIIRSSSVIKNESGSKQDDRLLHSHMFLKSVYLSFFRSEDG